MCGGKGRNEWKCCFFGRTLSLWELVKREYVINVSESCKTQPFESAHLRERERALLPASQLGKVTIKAYTH